MNVLNRLYEWYGKRNVLILIWTVVLLAIAGLLLNVFTSPKEEVVTQEEALTRVSVSRVDQLGTQSLFRVIGEVRALSEARLQAEAGGRITAVNVALGQRVGAGAIIASMENSGQRAALLQAEGAYDAALAGAVASESSTESAETGLDASLASGVNNYKSGFISADSSVRNTIDDLFNDPTGSIPGFKLDAFGNAPLLNAERGQIEIILDTWSSDTQTTNTNNIETRLGDARSDIERIAKFAETLAGVVARQDTTSSFTQAQKDATEASLLGVRSSLNGTGVSLETSITAIESSREALTRAEIAGSGSTVSLSQAQVKSALGSLRAAQSAYEKTVVRTPIAGVVNALYVKTGEYAAPGAPAAVIANNNALEIVTALSENDASLIAIGDTVLIEGDVSGVITAIAPAIDPLSGKKEIRIGVEEDMELTNGDTVTIEFKRSEVKSNDVITVPLSALKITATDPIAFTLKEDGTLEAHNVVLGKIMGDVVEVKEGLTPEMRIITDARGLRDGQKVEVITE